MPETLLEGHLVTSKGTLIITSHYLAIQILGMHLHAHLLTGARVSIAALFGIVKCAHTQLQRPVSRGDWIIHPGQVSMSLVWDDVQPSEPLEMPSLPVEMHD